MRPAYRKSPYKNDITIQQLLFFYLQNILYVIIIFMAISGYLQAVFNGMPVEFWGIPLPNLGAVNQPLSEALGPFWSVPLRILGLSDLTSAGFFGAVHSLTAYALAGLICVHIGNVALTAFEHAGAAVAPAAQQPCGLEKEKLPLVSKIAQRLANDLRFFGWIEFWLQLVLALLTGLLLQFAASGRAFSPGAAGFSDAIYWGTDGFFLLLLAIPMAYYYTRAARRIVSKPDSYLGKAGVMPFWWLTAGMLISALGVLISLTGIVLSIVLLIVKTVSQPPGIAITDPAKIVRALDVFVLIVNFFLLMAHSIGAGIALWLGIRLSRARLKYMTVTTRS
jgi:hypothetical protein